MNKSVRPRVWPTFMALIVLNVLWLIVLEIFIVPGMNGVVFISDSRRLLWWTIPPFALVSLLFASQWGSNWIQANREERIAQAERQAQAEHEKIAAITVDAQKDRERYSLEIYGLGCAVDRFNQDSLWEALKVGSSHASILPHDPKAYPWSADEKCLYGAIPPYPYEKAIVGFPEKWELPFLLGGPPLNNPEDRDFLKAGLCGARSAGGMHWHRFRTVSQSYSECPDQLPAEAFRLFEQNLDLPAVAIAVKDSLVVRDALRKAGTAPLLKDGCREPGEMTASKTVLLFGRRDRVEMLRPLATSDSVQNIWIPIESTLFGPNDTSHPDYISSYDEAPPEPPLPPGSAFKPSRFVKRPWCKEQLAQFDELKVLARLHRPQTAHYVVDGHRLTPNARQASFLAAWKAALSTLPVGTYPERVIYDFGPKGATHLAPLVLAINAVGPDLDVTGKNGLNVTERLGDTCANAPYVALALGVLATQNEGGVSAVVNLRREDRATVIMVSPP